jgi:hypothetical protein
VTAALTLAGAASAADPIRDTAELSRRTAALEERAAAAGPREFQRSADAFGELVARARALDAEVQIFAALLATRERLSARGDALRRRLEAGAGEDDAALEALYRSEDWQRLDYADAMLGYWAGWAQLARGQRLGAGDERRAAMTAAEAAFSRSALELSQPRIAAASLLGLGAARRDLGDLEGAVRVLEALELQLTQAPDSPLRDPVSYELACLAFMRGDLEEGLARARRLPADALSAGQRLALLRLEAEAWLGRAEKGDDAAEQAAARLREMSARGEAGAQIAAALAAEHRDLLAGLDVGPSGELLAAEAAFDAERWAEASERYARVLRDARRIPGLDLDAARYRRARALAETGDAEAAAQLLEQLLARGGGGALRAPAALLLHHLAERLASETPGPAAEARALRAARARLELVPEGPGADHARYRVARSGGTSADTASRIAELERIESGSPAYVPARLELVRLRSARLEALAARGRRDPEQARRLAEDVDAAMALAAAGKLPADPARDATLGVLRARAAAWSGESPEALLRRIERAESRPGLEADARRALLRLRIAAHGDAGDAAALEALLARLSDAELRRDWAVWREAVARMAAAPALRAVSLRGYERLTALAGEAERRELQLDHAGALLAARRGDEALRLSRSLVEAQPDWGDAWALHARALDAAGEAVEARDAWSRLADGIPPDAPGWVEAQLGLAEAARRSDDRETACRAAGRLEAAQTRLSDREAARLATVTGELACD